MLSISKDGRYFSEDGKPFFWLGDTAWMLFHKCNLEEAYRYLRNRKELGYNVIQAVLINNLKNHRNSVGVEDPSTDVTAKEYWEKCDKIIQMAAELGLYIAALPAWGSLVKQNIINEDNATEYADFLGKRYQSFGNVIWLLGGDVRGDVGGRTFHILGQTLKKYNPERLIGYHPFGRTSTIQWFQNTDWLDFHMFQSGHRRYDQACLGVWDDNVLKEPYYGEDNWRYVEDCYRLEEVKPVLDGEPSYEAIPKGLHNPHNGYWTARDIRRYAYWSVFAGAAGHTYGNNAIMQFYDIDSVGASFGVREYWHEALHHEGAGQMRYLKDLMMSVDFTEGSPMDEVLLYGQRERYFRVATFGGEDFLLCYTYSGDEFMVDLTHFKGRTVDLYWLNPQSGVYSYIETLKDAEKFFAHPAKKDADINDWVLVIKSVKEDAV